MKHVVKSLYVEIKREEYDALRARAAELEAALNQAHMALVGYLPGHRNAITDSAIESAGSALKARPPSGVVLPEQDGSHAQIAFWAGYELAVSNLHNGNIRVAWNDFKGSEQFKRLNSPPVSAGGVYSSDPLACSGCVSGCARCRASAGVVDERAAIQTTPFISSTGENRNPIYEGQFDDESPEQSAARLHWARVAIEMARAAQQPALDVSGLVDALQPFADFIEGTDPVWSDDRRISTLDYDFTKLRLGLFRKARAALTAHRAKA